MQPLERDSTPDQTSNWPAMPQTACTTLQLWMQIVGKVRLALMPAINHTWSVTLYPTIRGFTTAPMPYGTKMLQIDFDFIEHLLIIEVSEGGRSSIPLLPMTVAAFYGQVMAALVGLGTPVHIWPMPVEIAEPIRFEQDLTHCAYDAEYARRFWHIVLQTTRVFTIFRARFRGKVSPIHLFWGALDLACTRFSGRTAPEHPSMAGLSDRVTRDAYSHEVSSCGFWPGGGGFEPLFYSYAYPMRRVRLGFLRPSSIRSSANLYCPMKTFAKRQILMRCCFNFYKLPMRPPQTVPGGTEQR
jgi:hypothetical protein